MDFLARPDCEALRAAQRVSEAWMAEVRECRRRRFRRPLAERASDVEYNRVRGDIRVTATRRDGDDEVRKRVREMEVAFHLRGATRKKREMVSVV